MIINSQYELGKKLTSFDEQVLKNEVMFFNCDWFYAYEHGGDPTKEFLLQLPTHLHSHNTIIDSRVHMLMPGWYPCIPGWHHDDVPRGNDGQPDYYTPPYRSHHALALYNGSICPTEFAVGQVEFSEPDNHAVVYKEWHKEVVENIQRGKLEHILAPADQIVLFDDRTWHQGTAAVANGWRLFLRASWNTHRKPTNEIRRQTQVYMEDIHAGW
jgi:hypothetical protein